MSEVTYESDLDGIRFKITHDFAGTAGLLGPGQARALLTELQRITGNAGRRLVYVVNTAYPNLQDHVHRSTSTSLEGARAGLEIIGDFFPLLEFDTKPHFPPSSGPSKKFPNRESTRLWLWLQRERGFPEPAVSAYPLAKRMFEGRSFYGSRHSRLSGGKSATFGAYAVTNAFVAESERLWLEYSSTIARALRGELA